MKKRGCSLRGLSSSHGDEASGSINPTLQSGGQNERWATSGPGGCIRPTVWRSPNASQRGAKSEVAHKWAGWVHNPFRLRGHQCFRAEDKIRSDRQVGWVATYPLPFAGSPTLKSGGQNQQGPTSAPRGDITPSARGSQMVRSGRQNQKWLTSGPDSYACPAA